MSRTEPHLTHMSAWCYDHRGSQKLILEYIKAHYDGHISAGQISRWLAPNHKRTNPSAEHFLLLCEAFNHVVKNWKVKQ